MEVVTKAGCRPVKMWTSGLSVEPGAVAQVEAVAALPFVWPHVAVMPDVHAGIGATVGSVIPSLKAIVPAAVGVDIGCGMQAIRLGLTSHDLPTSLAALRSSIEGSVPHGRTDGGGGNDKGRWSEVPTEVEVAWMGLEGGWKRICEKHPKVRGRSGVTLEQLGSLGSGNHFVELCLDENDSVWVMLHSGSRGVGNRIGTYFIDKAKEEMEKYFITLSSTELAYLPEGTDIFKDYVDAVSWAQNFAAENRRLMMENVLRTMKRTLGRSLDLTDEVVDCHHNYISKENHFGKNLWVTRKGAVSARKGQLGIIPGSMGAKSFIVSGKGNKDSLCSCSHGAGRKMSRTAARQTFTLADHRQATEGVECRKDRDVIDETPGAYKDIEAVMAAQSDLVDVVHTLKQIVCVKG